MAVVILRESVAVMWPGVRYSAAGRPGRSARRLVSVAALAVAAVVSLVTAVACAGPAAPQPRHDQGLVVAHLSIPFRPAAAAGKAEVIQIAVTVGQRFSIKVDTSDRPYYWSQAGTGPDPRLVRLAGNFDEGRCAPGLVGCRVPYFHTLVARGRGTTMVSWKYHDLRCEATPKSASPASGSCPSVTLVTFDIMVR